MSKTDAQHDADSFSLMLGIGGFFTLGERNSFSYGYSYSDSKANENMADLTAEDTNAIGHSYTFGHDFILTPIISTSLSVKKADSLPSPNFNKFVGTLYFFALSIPYASGLFEMTQTISPYIFFVLQAFMIASKLDPLPEIITTIFFIILFKYYRFFLSFIFDFTNNVSIEFI